MRFVAVYIFLFISIEACKKKGLPPPAGNEENPAVVVPAVDPAIPATVGFFSDNWSALSYAAPVATAGTVPATTTGTVTIDRSKVIAKIPQSIYGNNANLWMTQIVTEQVLMQHLKDIAPPIIRFPGGSISDIFFWNAEKDTPPSTAPAMHIAADGTSQPAGYWFGKNKDGWTFSVENYYQLLQQTQSKGLITINYGYARYGIGDDPVADAAHLAAEWVRYDNGRTQYWEIGNENFGDWEAGYRINTLTNKDGQPEYITGSIYGQHVKVFADSMRKAAAQIGKKIYIGAVMVESESPAWATVTHKTWNEGMLKEADNSPDYYIVHNYYTPYYVNSNAATILATAKEETEKMMLFVKAKFTEYGAAVKPVVLDEWNIFSTGSLQQVSHINGLHATMVLGETIKNGFGLTARWDLANGWDNGNDHGMFSQGEPASGETKWQPRPAYYHMYFFQKTIGDRLVEATHAIAGIQAYAGSFSSGETSAVLVNTTTTVQHITIDIKNFNKGDKYYWYTLSGDTDNGEFSRKVIINNKGPEGNSGGNAGYKNIAAWSASAAGGLRVTVPARAAVYLVVDNK